MIPTTPHTRHLQLHLFEPAKDVNALPLEIRRQLLPLITALLGEAANIAESELVPAATTVGVDNE